LFGGYQVDGLQGLDTIKRCEVAADSDQTDATGNIIDLEDAAHAEELCKVREEKAELRVSIAMSTNLLIKILWIGLVLATNSLLFTNSQY